MVDVVLEFGFYVFFVGILIFKNVEDFCEMVWCVLCDRFFVEMDLFYLVFVFKCGK